MRRGRFTQDQIIKMLREHETGVKTVDLIENRPALSRWHPHWKDAFARFMQDCQPY